MAETAVDKTGGAGETDEKVAGGTTSEQRADSPGASEDAAYSLEQIEMLTVVGTGTFGRVLLVRHRHSAAFYALKVMSIADVLRLKQERHVQSEKDILRDVQPHPFIIQLFWTHHDERFLYMLMEFVSGGELFSYLRTDGRFAASRAAFFAAEITCALAYLHSRAVVYRDLKPENVLLDRDGHVKLTDFGFAKILQDRRVATWTMCGTPEYLAPEIIQSKGYGKGVDWWALGVLIFEMLCGYPPFYDEVPINIYKKILDGKVEFPRQPQLDLFSKDLIKKLLASDRTRRLGNMKDGAEDVKRHRWFKHIDWALVPQRKLKPPIIPKVSHAGDISNFESYPEEDWKDAAVIPAKDREPFRDF
ncbi:cAMP-dependent protein kinase catalytic subunit PRKX [Lethenteron reissneri]|uniref:cAMP-dependent protein kinase catalytic subunit PRKX n=1 Tax=Lethenteron reissneri TaxID=7753 RepID=UPI002AB72B9B|nr:cAMP-dependent protein kinase catalytic subunit PRKX [Lethenteron reissneri]